MTDQTIARHPRAETHPTGQRVVVFHTDTRDSIVLNPTGSWLWNQLERPKTGRELVESMRSEFPDVAPETLEADLRAYIRELEENCILVVDA